MPAKVLKFTLEIIGLIVLAIYVLSSVVISQDKKDLGILPDPFSDADHPVRSDNDITMPVPFSKSPDKFMVYKVEHSVIDKKWVEKFAKQQFNIDGKAIEWGGDDEYFQIEDKEYYIRVDTTNGTFTLQKINSLVNPQGDFPSEDESRKTAEDFLKKYNLLVSDVFFGAVSDNTKSMQAMTVGFGRKIGDIECWGAGSQIIVEVGRGRAVIEILRAWQDVKQYKEYPIKTSEQAFEEIKKEGIFYNGTEGEVKKIDIVYYSSPNRQDYLIPCYRFTCSDKDGKEFTGLATAVKDEYIKR